VQASPDLSRVEEIIHATTVATNALIQRKGARVGMITTKGFRDVLSLRRRDKRSPYGLETAFTPLIPRELRREVDERSAPDGTLVAVNPDEVLDAATALWSDGAEAILIAFLHSTTCPDNEQSAYDALVGKWPDALIFKSHALTDVPTEFERFSTGAASAYVAPLLRDYLSGIRSRLDQKDSLRVVVSDGGLVDSKEAEANPVRTALSGPAAGVWGACAVCERLGYDAFVACDMGGTSFDACLVKGGSPSLTRDRALAFGLPLAVEMLDIATIGAGGGSIVTVSPVGTVEVGPEGVGADPGPACYGRQVHRATVTDADLILGRISPTLRLPSGERDLDVDAARQTMNERVAQPIGISVEEAASLVLSTVEEKMADEIRRMGLKARVDVSGHVLFAYGGAGPLHAAGIVGPLGISKIVIPHNAGLFSAWGGLLTQARDTVSTVGEFELTPDAETHLRDLLVQHRDRLTPTAEQSLSHSLACREGGAMKSVDVSFSCTDSVYDILERIRSAQGYHSRSVYVTRVSTACSSPAPRQLSDVLPSARSNDSTDPGSRSVRFPDGQSEVCPVLDRASLDEGETGEGPCIIEEPGATTVVPPGFSWQVGELALLCLEKSGT